MSRLTSSLTVFLSVAVIAASDASFAQTPAVQMSAGMPAAAAVTGPAPAAANAAPSAPGAAQAVKCTAPSLANRLDQPLRRLAKRMAAGQPVTIVAIGSSSTAGAG